MTARAKGLRERRVVLKYPVRVAINPLIKYPGAAAAQRDLGRHRSRDRADAAHGGALFMRALINQDMYLAGSFLMALAVMLVVGNLLADITLAWLDRGPRLKSDPCTSIHRPAGCPVLTEALRSLKDESGASAPPSGRSWRKFRGNRAASSADRHRPLLPGSPDCRLCCPYGAHTRRTEFIWTPPQTIRLFDGGALRPWVPRLRREAGPDAPAHLRPGSGGQAVRAFSSAASRTGCSGSSPPTCTCSGSTTRHGGVPARHRPTGARPL